MIVKYSVGFGVFLPLNCYDESSGQEVTLRDFERDVGFEGEFMFSDSERIRLISAQSRLNRIVEKFSHPL